MSNRLVEARLKRRSLFLELLGGECVNCGTSDNLEFDHVIREDMSFRIGTAILMRLDKVLVELQKCQLLCHDCHVEKTNTEYIRTTGLSHGTASGYVNHKCRCDICTKAWNLYLKSKRYYRK